MPILTMAIIAAFATPAISGPRDPFPIGHSMMSQGAIIDPEGPTGRQPWVSAALYRDTLRYGVSAAAVSYHGGGSVSQYAVGGFGAMGPIVAKLSLSQLDALGVYYEQSASLSLGGFRGRFSYSLDASLYRAALRAGPQDSRTSASIGAALHLRTSRVNADAALSGFALFAYPPPAPAGIAAPLSASLRLCTVRNRYGVQGAVLTVTPSDESPLRIALAQEYRIGGAFSVSASVASNPTAVGFGITAGCRPLSAAASAVNHPALGWSRGAAAEHSR
jgi:hypothetical protein